MYILGVLLAFLAICQLGQARYNPYHALRELVDLAERADRPESALNYQKRAAKLCSNPVDIVFILDESRSIWGPDFQSEKDFVKEVIKVFDPTQARFGVETFSVGADIKFHLGDFTAQEDVLAEIDNIQQANGDQTQTWAALQRLYKEMLTDARGRPGVQKVAILITDGASQEAQKTIDEASNAHKHGITVFAIGVKREVRKSELEAIASDPDSEYMYMLDDWNESLDKIKESLAYKACPSNIEDCTNSGDLDIVFSVSGRATSSETQASFGLIESLLGKMKLGPEYIQVGLAPRTCPVEWTEIALNTHDSKESFNTDLKSRITTSFDDLKDRLKYLESEAFLASNGDRDTATNVGILFIDSPSGLAEAEQLADKAQGKMELMVVGIGKDLSTASLARIASPGATNVFHVDSYSQLTGLTDVILASLCQILV